MAIQFNHKSYGSLIGSGTYRFRHYGDEGPIYDYGDGHLNTVVAGYRNTLYVNGSLFTPTTDTYYYGNYYHSCYSAFIPIETLVPKYTSGRMTKTSSTQTYTFSTALDTTKEYTISNSVTWGGLSGSCSFSSFTIIIDGTNYSLQQAVNSGLIKPLVIVANSSWSDSYTCKNVLNAYTNSSFSGVYAYMTTVYMTNKGHTYSGFTVSGSNLNTTYDGCYYNIYDIDNLRLTVASY